jgi:hypothetical protein
MEQLDGLLKGADLTLDDDVLDRIDETVPPGTDLHHYQSDGLWESLALTDPTKRRRPISDRAAA